MPRQAGRVALLTALWTLLGTIGTATPALSKEPARPAAKAPTDKAFKLAKKDFQQKVHAKKSADRAAALRLLADFPIPDSADLVYVTLLDDRAEEVRRPAIEFLYSLRDRSDVTDKLLQRMTATTRKDGMDVRAIGTLQALGGTEDDQLQFKVLDYLNEFLGTPQADQYQLHGMIDELSREKADAEVMRMLMLFTRTELFNRHFGFRRCVVQGLFEIKEREAITHLINLLPRFKGLVQFDVVTHLVAATGQDFGDDAGKWKQWWTENQGKTTADDKPKIPPMSQYGKFGEYHGIPICAKRVVFVLDTSLSMRGAKIDAAKAELIRAIRALPKEVNFSVISFDNTVRIWQRELVSATEQMKHIAVNVVIEQPLGSNTASYDALEAAFSLEPEAIFFLSDGAPMGGKIDDPKQIVHDLSSLNRVRRISVHSIGVDTNLAGAAIFARFMKSLAETNWGIYKAVN
ncbi:MAG: VWA domain-containing protein [Planctomycetia bacterium]|nr:VWA domain-containing protein [Planctomycetia bacterium]